MSLRRILRLNNHLLTINQLSIAYEGEAAVKDVSFTIDEGDIFALIGESGSGKSSLAKAILGLLGKAQVKGQIAYKDEDLLAHPHWREVRGKEIAMIYQNPGNYLNPYKTIHDQFEVIMASHDMKYDLNRIERVLHSVSLLETERILASYPFQLSGGMQQRVAIAMALILEPKLLIADEPTSALDVLVQEDILETFRHVHEELDTTILLITHNLQTARKLANRVGIMYQGRLVEIGYTEEIMIRPQHEYTKVLLDSLLEVDHG